MAYFTSSDTYPKNHLKTPEYFILSQQLGNNVRFVSSFSKQKQSSDTVGNSPDNAKGTGLSWQTKLYTVSQKNCAKLFLS